MKTVVFAIFLALICSPSSATDSVIGTELFKFNLTSLIRLLHADKYELFREFNELGVADEIGGIIVVVAEILLVLSVLLLWGIFAFLAAVVTVGGSLIDAILGAISTSPQEILDFVRDYLYEILPPIVNPMLDLVQESKLASVADHALVQSKAVILGATLFVLLLILNVALFVISIFTLLKVKSIQSNGCGGNKCKESPQQTSNNNE